MTPFLLTFSKCVQKPESRSHIKAARFPLNFRLPNIFPVMNLQTLLCPVFQLIIAILRIIVFALPVEKINTVRLLTVGGGGKTSLVKLIYSDKYCWDLKIEFQIS
jgi:hypothetical protein